MPLSFKLRRTRFQCVHNEVGGRARSEIGEPPSHVTRAANLYAKTTVPVRAFLGTRPTIRYRHNVVDALCCTCPNVGVPMTPLAARLTRHFPRFETACLVDETVIPVKTDDETPTSRFNVLAESPNRSLYEMPARGTCGHAAGSLVARPDKAALALTATTTRSPTRDGDISPRSTPSRLPFPAPRPRNT